jgi:rRNA small subunit pseudouridine methyltransferase Nep1
MLADSAVTATSRRRRQSLSGDIASPVALSSEKARVLLTVNAPPRPKSTPAHERRYPTRRRAIDDEGEEEELPDAEKEGMYLDENSSSSSRSSSPTTPTTPASLLSHAKSTVPPADRPTRPLPQNRARKTAVPSKNPMQAPANPHMLPVQAHVPKGGVASSQRRLFVILEQACLEAYRVSTGGRGKNGREGDVKYALLNCDDHQGILAKTGRDIADARPDITHQVCRLQTSLLYLRLTCSQCLLTLLDSPLNKAGLLQIYIHTAKGVLIEVNPHVRIPRTFKRFSGLMGAYTVLLYPAISIDHPRQSNSFTSSPSAARMVLRNSSK